MHSGISLILQQKETISFQSNFSSLQYYSAKLWIGKSTVPSKTKLFYQHNMQLFYYTALRKWLYFYLQRGQRTRPAAEPPSKAWATLQVFKIWKILQLMNLLPWNYSTSWSDTTLQKHTKWGWFALSISWGIFQITFLDVRKHRA